MTKKQVIKITNLKMRNKELLRLLTRLKRDLNYLVSKVNSSIDKTLIHSRIDMIKQNQKQKNGK